MKKKKLKKEDLRSRADEQLTEGHACSSSILMQNCGHLRIVQAFSSSSFLESAAQSKPREKRELHLTDWLESNRNHTTSTHDD